MFGFIRRRVNAFFLETRRFVAALKLFLAVALVVASIAGSFFVPTKALSVLISSIGCFAAGWLFAVFFATALKLGSKEQDLARSLAAEKKENVELKNEVVELRAETKRLENQRIDINAVRPVLKLGLEEADMSIKDVEIEWLDDFDNGHMIELDAFDNGPKRSKYIGVLQRSFKATYGVDLEKLRIQEDGDCLRVAGIATESLGLKDDEITWLLCQTQQFRLRRVKEETKRDDSLSGFQEGEDYYEVDREKGFTGSLDLNETDKYKTKQIKKLSKRIGNGIGREFEEFQNINTYIRNMAKEIVKMLLAPMKKSIVFEPTPLAEIERDPNWLILEDFVKGYNKSLDALIES